MSIITYQFKIQRLIFMIIIHNQYAGLFVDILFLDYINNTDITITVKLHSYLKMYLHIAIAHNNR